MNTTSERKTFFAASEVAARREARRWIAAQTDVLVTIDTNARQTESGGWLVTVTFERW